MLSGGSVDFSIDSLVAFDAVVRNGSFSAAARELNKAQSGVSYAVGRLEEELGLELFDRSGHRARITDAGRTVLAEARNVLSAVQSVRAVSQQLREGWEPKLEIVIDGALPMAPIMGALKILADEQIPTTIRVKVEFLGGVTYRFDTDRADMMLVKNYSPRPELSSRPLPVVTSVLVASADHDLAKSPSVSLDDLQRFVELSVHDTSDQGDFVDETMFGGDRVYYLSDFNTKLQALQTGLGFGWLPTNLAEPELEKGTLVEIAYEPSRYSFVPLLVYRTHQPLGKAAQRFIEILDAM